MLPSKGLQLLGRTFKPAGPWSPLQQLRLGRSTSSTAQCVLCGSQPLQRYRTARSISTSRLVSQAAVLLEEGVLSEDEESKGPSDAEEKARIWDAQKLAEEVQRRRNFAIISHPDAGKTTMTEKLLLYGGAIHEAGSVKARRASRHATSDWMELEKQRGISITSTAMTFCFRNLQLNLLDTPGHQDFSEDTYRTLAAADNAVMLVDGAKGIEAQTRKLFEVVRLRSLPIFTFVNKMDRPALGPLEIMDQLEAEFGLQSWPVNWPIGSGDQFVGVYHRPTRKVHLYEKNGRLGRSKGVSGTEFDLDDTALDALIGEDVWAEVKEEIELIEEVSGELDMDAVRSGQLTPLFFGSAMSNFGVELFLKSFIDLASSPGQQETTSGPQVAATDEHFSGRVFKLQANMDPKHRDRVAFIRVCSGKFERGMKVKVARTGRTVTLSRPQTMFAQDRSTVQEGFAGDIIGLNNPGAFAIGDTLFTGPPVYYPPIPSFSPELFAKLRCPPNQRKAFNKGLEGLLGEGAVQVLYSTDDFVRDPILAAVGTLQFEVVQYRLKSEYGVDTELEALPYTIARWVLGGWEVLEGRRLFNTSIMKDVYQRPVLVFRNQYALDTVMADASSGLGELSPTSNPPGF